MVINIDPYQRRDPLDRYFDITQNVASAAAAALDALTMPAATITITGATGITTATGFNAVNFGIPTLSAALALTITNAATVYIAGAPAVGGVGPSAITNAYSLWIDAGAVRLDGDLLVATNIGIPTDTNLLQLSASQLIIDGVALLNTGTALTGALGLGQVQIDKTSDGTVLIHRASADTGGGTLEFLKRRSAWGVVTNGDRVGTIGWSAADGVDAAPVAHIVAEIDGVPGANDMPGRLIFSTTADGGNSVTERMRINAAGLVTIAGNLVVDGGGIGLTADTDLIQIAANRMLVNGQLRSKSFSLTDGATIALDWDNGNRQYVTLAGNRTFTFANPLEGSGYTIVLIQDGTGSRTITWPAGIRWVGGAVPTLTTTASSWDVIVFIYVNSIYVGDKALNAVVP